VARAWTFAGVNTGVDLALALIEGDLGHDVAIDIARRLALPMLRGGGLPHLSPTLQARPIAAGMARVPLASGLKPLSSSTTRCATSPPANDTLRRDRVEHVRLRAAVIAAFLEQLVIEKPNQCLNRCPLRDDQTDRTNVADGRARTVGNRKSTTVS